ncbi:hypothetical protein HBI70_193480 [Parastagonospora nodorum]|nr:hypothetical protein HBI09_131990 [Parastagonospora nodorum]KAH4047767.1 hypothetical protein HBH49_169460 [Parastagonospora nodorum]KAH4806761.1 hypothetical protein HBH61_142660 [Parastagonospora nodorum]KAH4912994.1 hypothetical protein HBI80_000810 [Parastagonospora nodorum]KAH5001522.1 hypothetical protein HBI77_145040 [Parastagonospora nodorum]
MSWDTGATGGGGEWDPAPADAGIGDSWGAGDAGGGGGGDGETCRICSQTGHFARECPDKPEGGGLTGECFNCGQVGHNKADCTNERVERPFNGICNSCGVEGHSARTCPTNPMKCKLCDQEGHKALDCDQRRMVDWTGVPEMDTGDAWTALVDSAKAKDLDAFRVCLRAYARALKDDFDLPGVETALREDDLGVYLIAKKQDIAANMTIVDLIGNAKRENVLSVQLSAKPRRAKMAQGWPESPEQNLERLASCGYVEDIGVPLCGNCGELGHIRKHCKQEVPEEVSVQPGVECVYCKEPGHRARDCPKERINPFACKNCKQEGHNSKECPEPRSAENVECRKCNETGHFSKDCPNVAKRTCRNCDSEDHVAKECPEPRNPEKQQCRNCEKFGHFSKDCPEPKDWSKVQCNNCQQFGHTIKRCKEPIAEGDTMGDGGAVGGDGGWGATGDAGATASAGGGGW